MQLPTVEQPAAPTKKGAPAPPGARTIDTALMLPREAKASTGGTVALGARPETTMTVGWSPSCFCAQAPATQR
jgi:hypothetical protein